MDMPVADMDAPIVVVDAPIMVVDAPAVVVNLPDALADSPTGALILRIIADIEASYSRAGAIKVHTTRCWCLVAKNEPTAVNNAIALGYARDNAVAIHLDLHTVEDYMHIFTFRGRTCLPFGNGRIPMRKNEFTLSFRLDATRYDARKADFLALFRFVLDLHEVNQDELGEDFADQLNA